MTYKSPDFDNECYNCGEVRPLENGYDQFNRPVRWCKPCIEGDRAAHMDEIEKAGDAFDYFFQRMKEAAANDEKKKAGR